MSEISYVGHFFAFVLSDICPVSYFSQDAFSFSNRIRYFQTHGSTFIFLFYLFAFVVEIFLGFCFMFSFAPLFVDNT